MRIRMDSLKGDSMSSRKQTIISAEILYDGHGKKENCTVVVEGSKIIDVVRKKMKSDY